MWCEDCKWSRHVVVTTDYMTYLYECKLDNALYSAPNVGCPDVAHYPREDQRCGDCDYFGGGHGRRCYKHIDRRPVANSPACKHWISSGLTRRSDVR